MFGSLVEDFKILLGGGGMGRQKNNKQNYLIFDKTVGR
jgi:hypothetical protein